MNWYASGRKLSWCDGGTIPYLLGETESVIDENLRISGAPADIRTENLRNRSRELCRRTVYWVAVDGVEWSASHFASCAPEDRLTEKLLTLPYIEPRSLSSFSVMCWRQGLTFGDVCAQTVSLLCAHCVPCFHHLTK
jgi:hypothetical protein